MSNSKTSDPSSHIDFIQGAKMQILPAPVFKRILAYCCDIGMVSVLLYGLYFILMLVFIFGGIILAATGLFENLTSWATTSFENGNIIEMIVLFTLGLALLVMIYALLVGPFHAYFIYYELKQQTTPGKKIFGLSVIALDRTRLSTKDVILREMMRHLEAGLVLPALISMLATQKSQRLGDLMTGTMVVYTPKDERKNDFLYLDEDSFRQLDDQLTATQDFEPTYTKAFLKQVLPIFISRIATEMTKQEILATAETVFNKYYKTEAPFDLNNDSAKEKFMRFHAQRCFEYTNEL